MFQFLMGVALGFFVMWMMREGSTETGMRERAEDLGRAERRGRQQATGEAQSAFEGLRNRTTS